MLNVIVFYPGDVTRPPPSPACQDGSADAVVSVRLAPSYVTYNGAALRAVGAFFSSSQQLGIGTLQVGHTRWCAGCVQTLTASTAVSARPHCYCAVWCAAFGAHLHAVR